MGHLIATHHSPIRSPGICLDFTIINTVPVPSGIISWWPAGLNAQDAITNNHGTLYNNTTYSAGTVGNAFNFHGWDVEIEDADYVQIADAPSLNPTNGLTIDAWIYFPQDVAGQNMPIVSKDGWNRQYLLTKMWDDKIRAHVGIVDDEFYYI